MSNKFKSGLVFGFAMTLFFLSRTAIAWIAGEDLSTNDILKSFFASLLAGLVSGFLFGWLSNKFVAGSIITKSSKFEYDKNETIILQTPANHFVGVDAVGGNLFLTDKRLIFKSHNQIIIIMSGSLTSQTFLMLKLLKLLDCLTTD